MTFMFSANRSRVLSAGIILKSKAMFAWIPGTYSLASGGSPDFLRPPQTRLYATLTDEAQWCPGGSPAEPRFCLAKLRLQLFGRKAGSWSEQCVLHCFEVPSPPSLAYISLIHLVCSQDFTGSR